MRWKHLSFALMALIATLKQLVPLTELAALKAPDLQVTGTTV